LGEHLEQELGPGRRQRHVAQFVDDEVLHRLKIALLLEEPNAGLRGPNDSHLTQPIKCRD